MDNARRRFFERMVNPLKRVPLKPFHIASRFIDAVTSLPPDIPAHIPLTWIQAPAPLLKASALNFTAIENIHRSLDIGVEIGQQASAKILKSAT
jgi:hypothetical protein